MVSGSTLGLLVSSEESEPIKLLTATKKLVRDLGQLFMSNNTEIKITKMRTDTEMMEIFFIINSLAQCH